MQVHRAETVVDDLMEHVRDRKADKNSVVGGIARAFTSAFTGDVASSKEKVIDDMMVELRRTLDDLELFRSSVSIQRMCIPGNYYCEYFERLYRIIKDADRKYKRCAAFCAAPVLWRRGGRGGAG